MAVLKNRAKMSTSTTGTGTITLGSAEDGYQSFADAGVANADVVRYVIEDGNNFEIGTGTYTSSGTTLTRTVSESSNSDAAINLSGSATVFIGATAEDIPALYADNPSSTTTPTASGANAIAIGDNTTASGEDAVAIGDNVVASGLRSISLGGFSDATGDYSVALGAGAQALGENAVAIKGNANYQRTTAIGMNSGGSKSIAGVAGTNTGGATALGGSYAGALDSFAAAIANNSSSYGATGANSIAMGYQAKATGDNSRAMGYQAIASGSNSLCFSQQSEASGSSSSVIGGYGNVADFTYGFASGQYAHTNNVYGKMARANGRFAATGDAQHGTFVLRSDTTDATAEVLTSTNSTSILDKAQVNVPSNAAFAFHGTIVAKQSGSANAAAWKVEGLIVNNGGTTTLTNSATTVLSNTPSWGMALSADDTNDALAITVTGAASTNIRWVATIHSSEVTYA